MLARKGCIHPAQLRSSTVAKIAKKMASMSAALSMRLNLLGPDQETRKMIEKKLGELQFSQKKNNNRNYGCRIFED